MKQIEAYHMHYRDLDCLYSFQRLHFIATIV